MHHYSNQGNSILQTRTRRHEKTKNVLFESDPICSAIYHRSKGTVLKQGKRKSIKVKAANIKRGLEFKRGMGINLPDDPQSEAKKMFNIFLHPSKPPWKPVLLSDLAFGLFSLRNLWNSQRLIVVNRLRQDGNHLPASLWWMRPRVGWKKEAIQLSFPPVNYVLWDKMLKSLPFTLKLFT